ncbi:PREDICTED: G patch domain-containing protein 1 homolog [Polistes canadensis]|uniref:G patch domain-containing protein 1 homolog n=1 Tax=Polistes canadensis TaxID=91411 RepID=UPI000718BFB5|nr:PREDICTED: G patch domain-containing protein 1 homolog [Polistes canadensis]XP_014613752.1 PREDICTED: G patch domain-containing protein 1 homolog [Polistes canadensis]
MSDSEDENYATFGTALEPLDEENLPRKKAVTIEDQYAYDAQGRRRFHGAFTGGFSAGYFNTVGTRDGWKPQQFKSSRGTKAKAVAQQPEDFMDDEDVSIFGIAPKGIRANSDYEHHEQKGIKRGRAEMINNKFLSYNPVLKELLRPVRETVGIALLKKMGWKPGQGIGNRVTKKEKIKAKQQIEKVKIYGCSLPKNEEKEIDSNYVCDSDDENLDITFAPDDYEPFRSKGKDNYFGIGYSGLNRQNVLSNQVNEENNYQSNNKNLPIFGHAFGVGAFEADDEDIYEREDMSRYDSVLGPERKKSKTRWSKENISNDKESNSVEGFVQAKDKLNSRKTFAPPSLPKDYHAIHLTRKSRFYPPIPHQSFNEKRKNLNVTKRAKILEDVSFTNKVIQGQVNTPTEILSSTIPMSISNVMSEPSNSLEQKVEVSKKIVEKPKAQGNNVWVDKLNTKMFVSGGITGREQITSGLLNLPTNLNSSSTFADVCVEAVNNQINNSSCLKINNMCKSDSIEQLSIIKLEKDPELTESEQSSKSIKKVPNNDNKNELNKSTLNLTDALEQQKEEAARMEMFGKLTRDIIEWQPASIVCKRFNIPEPRSCGIQIKIEKKAKFSVFDSLDFDVSSRFSKVTEILPKDIDNNASTSSYGNEFIKSDASKSPTYYKTSVETQEPQIVSEKMKNFEASYEKIFGKTVEEIPSTKFLKNNPEQEFINEENKIINMEQTKVSKDAEKSEDEETVTTNKYNSEEKKDLFRAIFLSSSDESETETEENIDNEVVKSVLIGDSSNEVNVARNTSPPRGIFAKLDLEDLVKKSTISTEDTESNIKEKEANLPSQEPQTIVEQNNENKTCDIPQMSIPETVYGPMLPSRLIKDGNATADSSGSIEFSRPIFKSVIVPKAAEEFEGKWVELHKTKKSKKIKKKHKHKEHKSSKSKKKSKKHKR